MSNSTNTTQTKQTRNGITPQQNAAGTPEFQPSQDILQYLKDYSRAKPDVAALWCFGLGFVVGWKLKPW